eukprot:298991_1
MAAPPNYYEGTQGQVVQQQPAVVMSAPPAGTVQQQPAVMYVNQYGQPIAAPQVQVVQPQVTYVNQYGQPIAAPTVQTTVVQAAPVTSAAPQRRTYYNGMG